MAAKRLNLGCGTYTCESWINIDGSPAVLLANNSFLRIIFGLITFGLYNQSIKAFQGKSIKRLDIRKALPYQDNSVSVIYSSHLLEHLYYEEAVKLLKECFRVLEHGGICRIVVPDGSEVIKEHEGKTGEDITKILTATDRILPRNALLRMLHVLKTQPLTSIRSPRKILGAIQNFHEHKFYYNTDFLIGLFQKIGFTNVSQKGPHQSRIFDISQIESMERASYGAIVIEGVKP